MNYDKILLIKNFLNKHVYKNLHNLKKLYSIQVIKNIMSQKNYTTAF